LHAETIWENCANPTLLQFANMCVNNITLDFSVAEIGFKKKREINLSKGETNVFNNAFKVGSKLQESISHVSYNEHWC
jgi:hypothetical protein